MREKTSMRTAESFESTITMSELASGWPPKSRISEVLNAEVVDQARAGPWEEVVLAEPLTSCQGGEDTENGSESDR